MTAFLILFALLLIGGFALLGACLLFRYVGRSWTAWNSTRRVVVAAVLIAVPLSPVAVFKIWEREKIMARVPPPLEAAAIEYRLEEAWGIGMPGDNETGFVVYRLTNDSASWARSKGHTLTAFLSNDGYQWHPTPIRERPGGTAVSTSKAHPADFIRNLRSAAFSISVEEGRDDDANDAIARPGSFYSYGRGGSVTVVDPKRGKVYFAYAG